MRQGSQPGSPGGRPAGALFPRDTPPNSFSTQQRPPQNSVNQVQASLFLRLSNSFTGALPGSRSRVAPSPGQLRMSRGRSGGAHGSGSSGFGRDGILGRDRNMYAHLPLLREGTREGLRQGLTLVHFSAQLERFPWDRGCVQGLFRMCGGA